MQNNKIVLASTISVGVSSCATRTPEYDLCIDSFDGDPEFISECAFLLNDPLSDALSSSVMFFSGVFLLVIWLMPIKNWFVNSIAKDLVKSRKPFEMVGFLAFIYYRFIGLLFYKSSRRLTKPKTRKRLISNTLSNPRRLELNAW